MKYKKNTRRGYPVALLIGLEQNHAVLWQVFSQVVKQWLTIPFPPERRDSKTLYEFHESIVKAIQPSLNEGVRSIIIVSATRTMYSSDLLDHIRRHHAYLLQSKGSNKTIFAKITGSADSFHDVAQLVKTKEFQESISSTTSEETDQIAAILDQNLGADRPVLFALKEIEDTIYSKDGIDSLDKGYLVLTNEYLIKSRHKNRIHRLLQIAANRKVKTKIVNANSPGGRRITQMGGLVYFTSETGHQRKTDI